MKLLDQLFNESKLPEIKTSVEIETASILKLCGALLVTGILLFIAHKLIKKI